MADMRRRKALRGGSSTDVPDIGRVLLPFPKPGEDLSVYVARVTEQRQVLVARDNYMAAQSDANKWRTMTADNLVKSSLRKRYVVNRLIGGPAHGGMVSATGRHSELLRIDDGRECNFSTVSDKPKQGIDLTYHEYKRHKLAIRVDALLDRVSLVCAWLYHDMTPDGVIDWVINGIPHGMLNDAEAINALL